MSERRNVPYMLRCKPCGEQVTVASTSNRRLGLVDCHLACGHSLSISDGIDTDRAPA